MPDVTLRNHQLILLPALGIFLVGLCPKAFTQCARTAKAPDYSVCLPKHWGSYVSDHEDKILVCNRPKLTQCRFLPFGDPAHGAVVLTIVPSDRGYGIYRSPEELLRSAQITGDPPPDIKDVELPRGADGLERKCWVARKLLYAGSWLDTYTVTVGGRRFRISAVYNDEKDRLESYRGDCLRVLESITPIDTAIRK